MDPVEAARRIREQAETPWNEVRGARVQRRMLDRLSKPERQARSGRWALTAMAVAACVVLCLVAVGKLAPRAQQHETSVSLADGSTMTLRVGAEALATTVTPNVVEVRQTAGEVVYAVAKKQERTFLVMAGAVRVRVVGTLFTVAYHAGLVRVKVSRGEVEVTHGSRLLMLSTGEELSLADEEPGAANRAALPVSSSVASSAVPVSAATACDETETTSPNCAMAVASSGAPPAASSSGSDVPSPAELFRRVDDARAGGNSGEAVRLLRLLLSQYPRDGRADMARFTLGRLEAQRGNHALAAAAFESCGDGFRGEARAEAALEWMAGGQKGRAVAAAKRYLDRHPQGPRRGEMARLLD